MTKSESIKELAPALAKAQAQMKPATFDKVNPHYRSKYASLPSIMESVRDPLAKNGLATLQRLSHKENDVFVFTAILHSSGEWIEDDGVKLILDKPNMQGLGSAITYAKRYGISAMLGVVCDEDDDGNGAVAAPEIKNVTQVIKKEFLK